MGSEVVWTKTGILGDCAAVLLRLFLLFTLVPLAELWVLFWIADKTNWLVALGMVVFPAILGSWLTRQQGLRCLRTVREQVARGELPTDGLLDGLLILVAGVLLITPGLLTDTAGFLLLIPAFRQTVRGYLARRIQVRVGFNAAYASQGGWDGRQHVIDARVIDVEQGDANAERRDGEGS